MRFYQGLLTFLLVPLICTGGEMGPRIIKKPAFSIVGIEVRTNNHDEMTGNGKIGPQWHKFYSQNVLSKIPNRRGDTVLAVYTNYESDEKGEYSFIIGSEVSSLVNIPEGLVGKEIPAAKYAVFTSDRGATPGIVIDIWKKVWNYKGAARAYQADFEFYGANSTDPQDAQVDLYLSIR
jgi:predicted transcriptional regulator YdeE